MKKAVLISLFAMVAVGANAQVTSLMENFNVCDSDINGHFPPGWSVYNVVGAQVWKSYSLYGVGNSPCVEINGYAGGVQNANEDWMITPLLNLSSYANVYLNFYALYKYTGDSLHVMVSSNYDTGLNPDSTIFTWTELTHSGTMYNDTSSAGTLKLFEVNLTPFKANPIHVGFKYTSSTTTASRWNLDSVFTSSVTVKIDPLELHELTQIKVIGTSTPNSVKVLFTTAEGTCNVEMTDMTGHVVARSTIQSVDGEQEYVFSGLNLPAGVYLIRIANKNNVGIAKAVVR
jgi:hypothetical protein